MLLTASPGLLLLPVVTSASSCLWKVSGGPCRGLPGRCGFFLGGLNASALDRVMAVSGEEGKEAAVLCAAAELDWQAQRSHVEQWLRE